MFKETLLIQPKLDATEAKKMEDNLHQRFDRVAKKFGKGLLKAFVGGGVIGAAFAAINRLLNPLEEIETRIKSLIEQSDTISETAEKFGTSAGKYFKLQQLGQAAGLDDAGLKELLNKFKAAQEVAQKELADPSQGLHRSTVALQQFAGEKDIASAFFRAIQDLKNQDKETRTSTERSIFGDKLTGSARRFVDSDFAALSKTIGIQDTGKLDEAFKGNASISSLSKGLEAQRNVQSFVENSANLNEEMVRAIDEIEKSKITLEAQQLGAIADLKNAAIAINAIKGLVDKGLQQVEKLLGLLAPLAPMLNKLSDSRIFRSFGGGK
jgi:hypothetical protein